MVRKKPEKEPPPVKTWKENQQQSAASQTESNAKDQPRFTHTIGNTKVIVQTRQYHLITPLFGGGVEPAVNDLENLIRGTEIRGQLRFWWRAIRGWQFDGSMEKMKECEDEIWGSASNTSKKRDKQEENEEENWQCVVQIEVEVSSKGTDKKPFTASWNKEKTNIRTFADPQIPEYASFPLRPPDEELKAAKRAGGPEHVDIKDLREGVTFKLHLMFPLIWRDEVEAALWAWETFGGVGARTRRGFGALVQIEDAEKKKESDLPIANAKEAEEWIRQKLRQWIKATIYPPDLPHLSGGMSIRIMDLPGTPTSAWKNVIRKLQEFRQSPHGRENRSKWPEAETIRNITGYRKFGRLDHPQKFPRAAFGLPIVFHFKDEDTKHPLDTRSDPPEMTLQGAGEGQDRWASPLILKPLACLNGQALGMACVLEGSLLPENLLLKSKALHIPFYDLNVSQTRLTVTEAASPMPVQGQTNVLQAFLDFFKPENKSKNKEK